jgi:bacterioferritin
MNSHTPFTSSTLTTSRSGRAKMAYPSMAEGLAEGRSLHNSLNEALAAELVCALRRRDRHLLSPEAKCMETAIIMASQLCPDFELTNRLAERIATLGGHPEHALAILDEYGLYPSDSSAPLDERFFKDLAAERAAAILHRRLLVRLGIGDAETSGLLNELLRADEEQLRSLSELRWPHQGQRDNESILTTSGTA